MSEKIQLALINESGAVIPLDKPKAVRVEMKLEETIADLFSAICRRNNQIADDNIKYARKFDFALALQNYLREMPADVG